MNRIITYIVILSSFIHPLYSMDNVHTLFSVDRKPKQHKIIENDEGHKLNEFTLYEPPHNDFERLLHALCSDDLENVNRYLPSVANINHPNEFTGTTPLMLASSVQAVSALLARGADIRQRDVLGNTVLMHRIEHKHPAAIRMLLRAIPSEQLQGFIDEINIYGETALILATREGAEQAVIELLRARAGTNIAAKDGSTALNKASMFNRYRIVHMLSKRGEASESGAMPPAQQK